MSLTRALHGETIVAAGGQLPAYLWGESDRGRGGGTGSGRCAHAFQATVSWTGATAASPSLITKRRSLCRGVTSTAWPPPGEQLRRCRSCSRLAGIERKMWCRELSLRTTGTMPADEDLGPLLAQLDRLIAVKLGQEQAAG